MQLIYLPDGTRLQFPDGMSEGDIQSAIEKNFPDLSPPAEQPARMTLSRGGQPQLKNPKEGLAGADFASKSVMANQPEAPARDLAAASPTRENARALERGRGVEDDIRAMPLADQARIAQRDDTAGEIAREVLPKSVQRAEQIAGGDMTPHTQFDIEEDVRTNKLPTLTQDEEARLAPAVTPEQFGQDVGIALKGSPGAFKSALAGAAEGGDPNDIDWQNQAVKEARLLSKNVSSVDNPNARYADFLGIKIDRKDLRTFPQNAAFSLVSMAGSLVAGLGGSLATPLVGLATGAAAAGTLAYRMDTNNFMRDLRDSMDKASVDSRGKPLTDAEFIAIAESPEARQAAKDIGVAIRGSGSIESLRTSHGLYEAIPEAVGNMAMLGAGKYIFGEATKGVLGLATKIAAGVGSTAAEVGTETVTQMGQNNAEVRAGTQDGALRSFTSASDWWKSYEEVAGPILLTVSLTGGAGAVYAGAKVAGERAVEAVSPGYSLSRALEADIADRNFLPPDTNTFKATYSAADPVAVARPILDAPDNIDAITTTALDSVATTPDPQLEAAIADVVNSNEGGTSGLQATADTDAAEAGVQPELATLRRISDSADVAGGSESAVGGVGLPARGLPSQQLYTDGEVDAQQSARVVDAEGELHAAFASDSNYAVGDDGVGRFKGQPLRIAEEDSMPDASSVQRRGLQVSRQGARALREFYSLAGKEVIFLRDENQSVPFDGAVSPKDPNVIFLSDNPSRAAAFVAGHEFGHTLEQVKLPDGTNLHDAAFALVNKGLTKEGFDHQARIFADTTPAHLTLRQHVVNETVKDLGGWALQNPTFLPKLIREIEVQHGQPAAQSALTQLIAGIKSTIARIQKFFAAEPDLSAKLVTNLGEVHAALAKMYAQSFGTQLQQEKARIEAGRAGVQESAKAAYVREITAIRARTPEFKKWFGKSKVVSGGKPLVVYHGTEQDFEAPNGRFWATDSPVIAETYASGRVNRSKGQGAAIMPAHLSLQNPLVVDADGLDWDSIRFRGAVVDTDDIADIAQKEGHDGVIIHNVFDSMDGEGGLATTYAAFRPEQVKSVFNPRPTNNPSMSLSPKSEAAKIEASRAKDRRTGVALTKAMQSATLDEYLYGDRLPFTVSTQAELGELLQEMATTYTPARTGDTQENREFGARVIEHEVRLALGMDDNAVGWYAVGRYSHTIAAPIHPKTGTNRDALVMDRWFMRTWGRITGNLVYKKDGETFTRDAPGSGGERHYIRATMQTALERLQKDNPSLTMGDLQAILRHEEKDLYTLHNVNDEEPTDYAAENASYAKPTGIGQEAIAAARMEQGRPSGREASDRQQEAGGLHSVKAKAGNASGTEGEVAGGRSAQFSPKQESAASYGQGRDGAVTVTGVHYSLAQRATLDSRHYGTGIKGEEAGRVGRSLDALHNRTYFYVNEGQGVHPESGLGRHAHSVNLRNVYDTDADTLGLATKANGDRNKFEALVQAAGFDGYYVRAAMGRQGAAVLLGDHSVTPEYHGTKYDAREMTPPDAPVYSDTEQKARSIAYDKSLPDGELTGSDWKKILGNRAAGLKIQDDKTYYKSDLGKLVRDSAQFSVKRAPYTERRVGSDAKGIP